MKQMDAKMHTVNKRRDTYKEASCMHVCNHTYTHLHAHTHATQTHTYIHTNIRTHLLVHAHGCELVALKTDLSTPSGPLTFSLRCSKSNTSGVRRLGAIGQTEEQLTKPMHAELQRYKQTAFCVCVYNHTLLFVFYFWFFLYASLSLCSPTNHHTYQHGVLHHNAI